MECEWGNTAASRLEAALALPSPPEVQERELAPVQNDITAVAAAAKVDSKQKAEQQEDEEKEEARSPISSPVAAVAAIASAAAPVPAAAAAFPAAAQPAASPAQEAAPAAAPAAAVAATSTAAAATSTATGGELPAGLLLAIYAAGIAALPVVVNSEWALHTTGKPQHSVAAVLALPSLLHLFVLHCCL
jgi:hypothetical protein